MPSKFTYSIIAASLSSALLSTAAIAEDEQKEQESIEKIVILGEKADRTLKDTASSVSVISEEELKTMTHLSVSSAVSEISNVVVKSGAVPDIRGVSGNGSATGFAGVTGGAKGRVSTLIDGIYQPFMADLTGDSGIWDVEQIEVFRGPQSTTNGRNSIGGMIFIKTKDPTYDWQAAGRLGYRNNDKYVDTSVMVSGPLIQDELAFRFTAQGLDGNDYDNSFTHGSHKPKFDLTEQKTTRWSTKLLWEPKALDNFKGMITHNRNSEIGNTGRTYFRYDQPYEFIPVFERYMDTDTQTTKLDLEYSVSKDISVDALWAYMEHGFAFDTYEILEKDNQRLDMNEKNVTFDSKINFGLNNQSYKGFIGLAYFERDQDFVSSTGSLYNGFDSSNSKAIYGELSYRVNDKFSVISGLRFEKESQQRDYIENENRQGNIVATAHYVLDTSKTIRLPKLVLQYALTDEHTATISARRGYNSAGGAFNWFAQSYYYYDAEYVNTYEAGIRSSLNNGNLNLSANLFFNNYKGYQAMSPSRTIKNLDSVETYGLELEVSSMVTDNLQLKAGLGLLETEIKDTTEAFIAFNGNELNSAPKFTLNLGAKYWLNEEFNMGASVNVVDDYHGTFANDAATKAGDYSVARIYANYDLENWAFNVFINNVLDEQAVTERGAPRPPRDPYGYAGVVDPRTFGISATYTF